MIRYGRFQPALVVSLAIAAALLATGAQAGLTDKLKKKVQDAGKKSEEEMDKAIGASEGAVPGAAESEAGAEGAAPEAAGAAAAAGDGSKVSAVSTKFDFVPGDSVIFADDFTQDELGEFPARWALSMGTLEVAEMSGQRWLRSTSIESRFRMKVPAAPSLPEFWTLELDFFCGEPSGNVLNVAGIKGDQKVWTTTFPYSGQNAYLESGKVSSNTPLENATVWGAKHHVMFMARGSALKVYIDRQRVANIPEIDPASGAPDNIEFWLWSDKEPMITNVRFAEGCKPAKDMLAEGKLVTYGIFFDSGSDVVKPESAPVLRQIAAYLEANKAVKLHIVGHTDNTGTAAGNLDLSKRRAASVARVLSEEFKIAADRFTADGKGDTDSVASNATSEGRAMNRRVEFSKA
jgi:outer membrane protein OmpA-like peptidoglycan-associated protein